MNRTFEILKDLDLEESALDETKKIIETSLENKIQKAFQTIKTDAKESCSSYYNGRVLENIIYNIEKRDKEIVGVIESSLDDPDGVASVDGQESNPFFKAAVEGNIDKLKYIFGESDFK